MSILFKVTLASLKKNKTRTAVTIFAILLATSMIAAVTTAVSSGLHLLLQYFAYTDGYWHGMVTDADASVRDAFSQDKAIRQMGYEQQIGYGESLTEPYTFCRYLYLAGVNDSYYDLAFIRLTTGRYPEKSGEILLAEDILRNHEVNYKVGDTITLQVGLRMRDGVPLWQDTPYEDDKEEDFLPQETKTYTIVGFCERPDIIPYIAGHYGFTVPDESRSDSTYTLYYTLKHPSFIYTFAKQSELPTTLNENILLASGVSDSPGFYVMLYGLYTILIGLIAFSAISLIHNAFSISVAERTRQFGLLTSIGATKKQLRKMVVWEAFLVSILGIPLGILLGVGGIAALLKLLAPAIRGLIGLPLAIVVHVSLPSLLASSILSLITIGISVWMPSKRAVSMTAVEAIRQNYDIKIKKQTSKTARLAYALFRLPGVLAVKQLTRNPKQHRSIVFSLFTSVLLFVSISSFAEYMIAYMANSGGQYEFDIMTDGTALFGDEADAMLEALLSCEAITDAAYSEFYLDQAKIPKTALTKDYVNLAESTESGTLLDDPDHLLVQISSIFVDDSSFRELIRSLGLDEDLYFDSQKTVGVLFDYKSSYFREEKQYRNYRVFRNQTDTVIIGQWNHESFPDYAFIEDFVDENGHVMCRYQSIHDEEKIVPHSENFDYSYSGTLSFDGITAERPFYHDRFNNFGPFIVYPISQVASVKENGTSMRYYSFLSDDMVASGEAIKKTFAQYGYETPHLELNLEKSRNQHMTTVIRVFMYSFVLLIAFTAAANVFNTISTGMDLRRREFAMLKSLGMSTKGLTQMLCYECLIYGCKSLFYGIPASLLVNHLLYRVLIRGTAAETILPWTAIGIASIGIFLLVIVTTMHGIRKIIKDNPLDSLKNENL